MNVAEIKTCDIANGPGVRTSLFVSGCTHRCQNCFNEMAWDFEYGVPYTDEIEEKILKSLEPAYIAGLTLLGGEPLEHRNQQGLLGLLKKVKELYPTKTIWCYTGYTFESDVLDRMRREFAETEELLSCIDVMVDGKFIQEEKRLGLKFRGSANQRIIMVQESLKQGKTVLWDQM